MKSFSATTNDLPPPVWFDELKSGLNRRSHFSVTGNYRDFYPLGGGEAVEFMSFEQVVWRIACAKGYAALIIYDADKGLRLHHECGEGPAQLLKSHGIETGARSDSPAEFASLHRSLVTMDNCPVVMMIDYAAHLFGGAVDMSEVFVEADRTARLTRRLDVLDNAGPGPVSPTLWLIDRLGDLPDWFTADNDTFREVFVERPNLEDRFAFAATLTGQFVDADKRTPEQRKDFLEQFALESDGMTLVGMSQVARLAADEGFGCDQITEAIRTHRLGTRRDPWSSNVMRARVLKANEILTRRVKGQKHAIDKALDILIRSIEGLSGAQTSSRHSRPRGTLFLVGPTGVGKTELAKAITELLFGDDTACHRFDMSEFMEENSVSRLIGAPPGHPGHERGGELINAIRKKPFSVMLFDEVEKAHPRILDMFLQILDEGRLTDARGSTAYFSETLIIFTSNIGMISKEHTENAGMNIMPSDDYKEVELKLIEAVRNHFRIELQRPELINRLGQNIVAFEFIDGIVASQIFSAIMDRVLSTIRVEHGVEIEFNPEALDDLRALSVGDWFEGGRGIANRIETNFINPISRELFLRRPERRLRVISVAEINGKTELHYQ